MRRPPSTCTPASCPFIPQVTSNENSVITLRGSTDIVVDFFQHAITCILYQRGIYPPEDFERTSKYGLALHVAKEEGLVAYIQNVLAQLKGAWVRTCVRACVGSSIDRSIPTP